MVITYLGFHTLQVNFVDTNGRAKQLSCKNSKGVCTNYGKHSQILRKEKRIEEVISQTFSPH